MDAADLVYAGAGQQAALIARREVSSREVVDACLTRIETLDPRLNAFKEAYAEQARAAADDADRRVAQGDHAPLLGVPVAVKDDIAVAGRVTGHGTTASTRPAVLDSPVVRLLREAGAIVLGKTNLPELAIYGFTESRSYGVTRNPWDVRRTPGGSSGGSAAAVAAGLVGIASGSDGAGSIRIPAACCGLFGFKPSPGRTVGSGSWGGLSVQGALARSVSDSAWYVDLIGAPGAEHLTPSVGRDPGRLVVGVSTTPMRAGGLRGPVDAELRAAVLDAAAALEELGHEVREVDLPLDRASQEFSLRYLRAIHDSVDQVEHPRRLERRTRQLVGLGGVVPARAARWAAAAGERDGGGPSGDGVGAGSGGGAGFGGVGGVSVGGVGGGVSSGGVRGGLAAAVGRGPRGGSLVGRRRAAARRPAGRRGPGPLGAALADVDLLLTPVTNTLPVRVGRWARAGGLRTVLGMSRVYGFTPLWNHTGRPAASVPAGLGADGLPLAVQLVGRRDHDADLVAVCAQLEQARPWSHLRPRL